MVFVSTEVKRKVSNIVENMENFATLADDQNPTAKVPGLDCAPGMGMPTDAKTFRSSAAEVNDGLFKILVMGKFKNGKSTFINALVSRSMMAAKATATTAVIATVSLGDDEDSVEIFYTDPRKNRRLSLESFNREFALTPEDQELIEKGGNCDRFADVNHVEMHSKDEFFQDGVTLIDSPGLEEANSRTRTTYEYVPRANAIIFTLCAPSLFSAQERKYIQENFVGKHLRNVFFVVNRIDNLNDSELEENVIPTTRKSLANVFTDEHGNFDEGLYNRRVFFTNAYGALRLRTGKPTQVIVDGEAKSLTLEDTGILKFEAALRDFLSSDERVNATFQSTLTNMANTYQRAQEKAESEKAARLLPLSVLEKNKVEADAKLKQAEDTVETMRTSINTTASLIAQQIYSDLTNFVATDLEREFASVVEDGDSSFGIKSMLSMAWSGVTGQNQNQATRPLAEKIQAYLSMQLENWSKRVPTLAKANIEQLQKDLNGNITNFSIYLNDAMNKFTGSVPDSKMNPQQRPAVKGIQAAIAALGFGDVSILVDVAAGGGLQWGDFIRKICMQYVIESCVILFAGPLALPAFIATEILQIRNASTEMSKKLLTQIGKDAFVKLGEKIKEQEMDLKTTISSQIKEQCEGLLTAAKSLVEDTRASQQRIMEEHDKGAEYAAAENARQEKVIQAMRKCVANVYEQIFNHLPTDIEISSLAVIKSEKGV